MPGPHARPGNGSPATASSMPVITLPKYVIEDKKEQFRRPHIKAQLGRLGLFAALAGIGLLLSN
jgi:hypothetical protein